MRQIEQAAGGCIAATRRGAVDKAVVVGDAMAMLGAGANDAGEDF
jgi:hypothetical protein